MIAATLRSLDALVYPRELLEIIVIDDGSTDGTLSCIESARANLQHRYRVLHFDQSAGKARRINQLARELTSTWLLVLDADHWVERDLILTMLSASCASPDVACVQVASQVRNGGINLLTRALEMEYMFRCRGIYPGKPFGVFVGSGGMFRRSALIEIGGFDAAMLTEDVELTYRLYQHGWRVSYDDSTTTIDLAPLDFKNFFNQRQRWMRGLFQALGSHLLNALGQRTRDQRAHPLFWRALPYLVQFSLDGFCALCFCVLTAYYALGAIGLVQFHFAAAIYALMLSSTLTFSIGFARSRRLDRLCCLGLLPPYMVAHTIPMAWALIDGYVLDKPPTWIKTERGRQAAPRVGHAGAKQLSREGA